MKKQHRTVKQGGRHWSPCHPFVYLAMIMNLLFRIVALRNTKAGINPAGTGLSSFHHDIFNQAEFLSAERETSLKDSFFLIRLQAQDPG